jgi:hypothetical protein
MQQLLAIQRNLASNPETFFRQLQSAGPRGDLSIMAAGLSGLTGLSGLSGLAAGLGLPLPQFGFPGSEGLGKSDSRCQANIKKYFYPLVFYLCRRFTSFFQNRKANAYIQEKQTT